VLQRHRTRSRRKRRVHAAGWSAAPTVSCEWNNGAADLHATTSEPGSFRPSIVGSCNVANVAHAPAWHAQCCRQLNFQPIGRSQASANQRVLVRSWDAQQRFEQIQLHRHPSDSSRKCEARAPKQSRSKLRAVLPCQAIRTLPAAWSTLAALGPNQPTAESTERKENGEFAGVSASCSTH
jgi:hypothetical protein